MPTNNIVAITEGMAALTISEMIDNLELSDEQVLGMCKFYRKFKEARTDVLTHVEIRLLQDGKKIQAIKAYRERTRHGLADAKRIIEAHQEIHKINGY